MTSIENSFPFDENHDISFKLRLYYKVEGSRTYTDFDAVIKLQDEDIVLSVEADRTSATLLYKEYKKKDYKLLCPAINSREIKNLSFCQPIRFTNLSMNSKGTIDCSMPLKKLSYQLSSWERKSSDKAIYRLSSSSRVLEGDLSKPVFEGNILVDIKPASLVLTIYGQRFTLFRDGSNTYLMTNNSNPELFLALVSLFCCKPIEILMSNRKDMVEVEKTGYKPLFRQGHNEILGYLFCNDIGLNNLKGFFASINKTPSKEEMESAMLFIGNYIRADYLDEVSKLLIYNTILEKMANVNMGEDTNSKINGFLSARHMDVRKMNGGIEHAGLRDQNGETIANFVQLRHFFVHHLGSKKAVEYLENSDLLINLKIAITILLLEMVGVNNIQFDEQFHSMSIFDDTKEETVVLTKLMEDHIFMIKSTMGKV